MSKYEWQSRNLQGFLNQEALDAEVKRFWKMKREVTDLVFQIKQVDDTLGLTEQELISKIRTLLENNGCKLIGVSNMESFYKASKGYMEIMKEIG